MKVFENKMLTNVIRLKKDEVIEEVKKMHYDVFTVHNCRDILLG